MAVLKKLRVIIVAVCCFFSIATRGQNFDKQFKGAIDNDVFALQGTDGYYTNGLFANYTTLAKKNRAGVIKTLNTFEIGQKIFTPGIREVFVVTELDRPITSYLYGSYNRSWFTHNNKFLKLGASVGTVGPAALGEKVLGLVHPLLKINARWWEWMYDYEIKNEIGVNVNGSYGFSILNKNAGAFQITPVSSATLGTSFTNISQSVLFQFGRQNQMYESDMWNTRLQNSGSKPPRYNREIFVYYQPEIMYQVYNATVQGGMFRNDKGRLLSDVEPFVFGNKVGVMYATPRFSAAAHISHLTKEAKLQQTTHFFGGLQFGYRFK